MKTCPIAGSWIALRSGLFACLLVVATAVAAQSGDSIELNPSHPDTYVVQRGDTLWDISAMFLKEPWFWPEIWYVNPQIEDPHLIYPGDVLTLVYVDGKPQLRMQRGGTVSGGTVRLSPEMRSEGREAAITTIPFQTIEPFLRGGTIMSKKEAESLPYIVAFRDHIVAGAGHEIFVRDIDDSVALGKEYFVLRMLDEINDPDTGKALGYEVLFIGRAEKRASGDPDTLFLTDTDREARRGDKVQQVDLQLPMTYFPSAPNQEVAGTIVSVVDGVSRIGQYQMVILNRGSNDGLEAGSVLAVWQKGETVSDRFSSKAFGEKVELPDALGGTVMVVKAYEDVSYALVMEALLEIKVGDRIRNP